MHSSTKEEITSHPTGLPIFNSLCFGALVLAAVRVVRMPMCLRYLCASLDVKRNSANNSNYGTGRDYVVDVEVTANNCTILCIHHLCVCNSLFLARFLSLSLSSLCWSVPGLLYASRATFQHADTHTHSLVMYTCSQQRPTHTIHTQTHATLTIASGTFFGTNEEITFFCSYYCIYDLPSVRPTIRR